LRGAAARHRRLLAQPLHRLFRRHRHHRPYAIEHGHSLLSPPLPPWPDPAVRSPSPSCWALTSHTIAAQILSFDLGWVSPLLIGVGIITFLSSGIGTSRAISPRRHRAWPDAVVAETFGARHAAAAQRTGLHGAAAGPAGEYAIGRRGRHAGHLVVHSSLSTVLLVIRFAGSGLISPGRRCALVIGANIGGALAAATWRSPAPTSKPAAAARQPDDPRPSWACPAAVPRTDRSKTVGDRRLGARLPVNFHTAYNIAASRHLRCQTGRPWSPGRAAACLRQSRWSTIPQHAISIPTCSISPAEGWAAALRETLNLGDRVADMLGEPSTSSSATIPRR